MQDARSGKPEVTVKLDDVSNFQPTLRHLGHDDFPLDLTAQEGVGVPPVAFFNELLTPFIDTPSEHEAPVFAVQITFVPGGVLVTLCLHHSVGDTVTLGIVANYLSSDLPSCQITNDDLRDEMLEQSRLRDRLSGSRGVKSDIFRNAYLHPDSCVEDDTKAGLVASNVLMFDLGLLNEVKDLLNEHFDDIHGESDIQLSCFDALAAILWKGISRALLSRKDAKQDLVDLQSNSRLIIPVNVRQTIEPALDDSYIGNASIPIAISSAIVKVAMPFEPAALARTARAIQIATEDVPEQLVRSMIASINECLDAKLGAGANTTTDVLITSWADIGLGNADVGLGLGSPKWVRKAGRSLSVDGCTVYPPRNGECEVSVQLSEDTMETLLNDENFMAFVARMV